MASNQSSTFASGDSIEVSDLIQIYKNPATHNEYLKQFEHIFEEKKSQIHDVVKLYNSFNLSTIEGNNQLYFKVINYDGKVRGLKSGNKNTYTYKYYSGLNIDPMIEDVLEKTTPQTTPNKIFDISGFSYCKLEDIHMYGSKDIMAGYIHPVIIPNSIPIVKELEYTGGFKVTKYKSPLVYTLPKIRLGSSESIELLMRTNQMNERFLKSYLYCSDDIENLIKFENLYSCYESALSVKMMNKYIHAYVKRMILQKRYDILFNKIITEGQIGYGLKINLTQLFYIFHKHGDGIFVKYLREYFYNKIIEKNREKLDTTIIDINVGESILKMHEFLDKNKDISDFFDFISEKNGVVSGSFALKYFTCMDWMSSDIDIYVNKIHKTDVMNYAIEHNHTHFRRAISIGKEGNKKYNMQGVDSMANLHFLNQEIQNIQVIFVDTDPWEFIKTNFDFDICMVGYRNNEFLHNHSNITIFNEAIVTDKYINKMVGGEKDCYSIYRAAKTIERIVKYIERGFKITNIDYMLDKIESHLY